MWSFGIIIHELIKFTLRGFTLSHDDFKNERYLFKGTSCFPISPNLNLEGENEIEVDDQM